MNQLATLTELLKLCHAALNPPKGKPVMMDANFYAWRDLELATLKELRGLMGAEQAEMDLGDDPNKPNP